jgi:hypothetical protein
VSGASPPWDLDLPAWVQWVAQDEDGALWGYEVEPLRHDHGWYENEVGRCVKLEQGLPESRWKDSLQRRPPSAGGH